MKISHDTEDTSVINYYISSKKLLIIIIRLNDDVDREYIYVTSLLSNH